MKIKVSSQLKPVKLSTIEGVLTEPRLIVDLKNGRYLLFPGSDNTVTLKFSTIDKNLPYENLTPKIASLIFDPLEDLLVKLSSKEGKIAHIVSQYNNILRAKGENTLIEYENLGEFVSRDENENPYVDPNKVTAFVDSEIIPVLEQVKGNSEKFIPWLFKHYVEGDDGLVTYLKSDKEKLAEILRQYSYAQVHGILSRDESDLNRVSFEEVLALTKETKLPTAYYLDTFLEKYPDRLVLSKGKYKIVRFEDSTNEFEIYVLNILSSTHWCTSDPAIAKSYLSEGNLYMILSGYEPRALFATGNGEFRNMNDNLLSLEELSYYGEILKDLMDILSSSNPSDYKVLELAIKDRVYYSLDNSFSLIFSSVREFAETLIERMSQEEFAEVFVHNIEPLLKPESIAENLRSVFAYPDSKAYRTIGTNLFLLGWRDVCPQKLFESIVLNSFFERILVSPSEEKLLEAIITATNTSNFVEYEKELAKVMRPEEFNRYLRDPLAVRLIRILSIPNHVYGKYGELSEEWDLSVASLGIMIKVVEDIFNAYEEFLSKMPDVLEIPDKLEIPVVVVKDDSLAKYYSFPFLIEESLEKVLREIIDSSEYITSTFENTMQRGKKYISSKSDNPIREVLDRLQKEKNVTFTVQGDNIYVNLHFQASLSKLPVSIPEEHLREFGLTYDEETNSFVGKLEDLVERVGESTHKEVSDLPEVEDVYDSFPFESIIDRIEKMIIGGIQEIFMRRSSKKISGDSFDIYLIPFEELRNIGSNVQAYINPDSLLERIASIIIPYWAEKFEEYVLYHFNETIKEIKPRLDEFPKVVATIKEYVTAIEKPIKEAKTLFQNEEFSEAASKLFRELIIHCYFEEPHTSEDSEEFEEEENISFYMALGGRIFAPMRALVESVTYPKVIKERSRLIYL